MLIAFRTVPVADCRTNIEDFSGNSLQMHNFRITPLWTDCTSLKNNELNLREFD